MRLIPLVTLIVVFSLASAGTTSGQDRPLRAPDAWAALERGDAETAAGIFREELDRSPRNAMLHYGAGYAAFMLGRTDAAMSSLKQALEYNPRLVEAMVLLAQVAYQSADLDLAIRSLESAAKIRPNDRAIAQMLDEWRKESDVHASLNERPGVHFTVLFEGAANKALSDRVAGLLEAAYWRIGQTLNSYPSETIQVILYSNRQFEDITRAPAWAGGGYDGRIRLPVSGALRSPATLDRVVTHEFVHAAIASAAPRGVPAWIHEGLASYLESNDHAWAARVLKQADGRLTMEQMTSGFTRFDGGTALVAYAESLVAGELLCEWLGSAVGPFLQQLGNGHTVDQALGAIGIHPEQFHTEWRRRIGAK